MSIPKSLNKLGLLAVLLVFLLPTGAQALDPYDLQIKSESFEPSQIVSLIISGPINMSFSARITVVDGGDIVAGRDAQLNATGQYVFQWTPSYEGTFNVTVVYATGFTIKKTFLIQEKVTDADIAQIYYAMFGILDRLTRSIEELRGLLNIAIALSVVSLIAAVAMLLYMRQNVSRMESAYEILLKDILTEETKQGIGKMQKFIKELEARLDEKKQ